MRRRREDKWEFFFSFLFSLPLRFSSALSLRLIPRGLFFPLHSYLSLLHILSNSSFTLLPACLPSSFFLSFFLSINRGIIRQKTATPNMNHFPTSCCCCDTHRRRPTIFVLFVLLISYWLIFPCAAGRAISEVALEEKAAAVVMKRVLIGSAPPRCERICDGCEHCEAIQVPVTSRVRTRTLVPVAAWNGRADSFSNYKPISWKCKCGSFIFNP